MEKDTETAVDVDSIVHANADPKCDHRQCRGLKTDFQHCHHCVGKDRNKRQRQYNAERAHDGPEGQQAQHNDRTIDIQHDGQLSSLNGFIGGSHDAHVATREPQAEIALGQPALVLCNGLYDVVDGFGLVVLRKNQDRHCFTTGIQKAGVGLDGGDGLRKHKPVARQHLPLWAAFIEVRVDLLGGIGQRHHRLHARQVLCEPGELINGVHVGVIDTGFGGCFGDDGQHIDSDAEAFGHCAGVNVVPRVFAELWNTRMQVADLEVCAFPKSEDEQHRSHAQGRQGPGRAGEARQRAPVAVALFFADVAFVFVLIEVGDFGE